MKCWHCNSEVIWGGDHSYEDYGREGDGIVSNLSCSKCNAFYLCYKEASGKEKDYSCKICRNEIFKVCNCKPVVNRQEN